MTRHALFAAGVLALAAAIIGHPAQAAPNPNDELFYQCDGFRPVDGSTDGVTFIRQNILFNRLLQPRVNVRPTKQGAAACTVALEDARLEPGYVMRRASLLRARAIHRLAAGQVAEALADLEAVRQLPIGDVDPNFHRSIMHGVDLATAYVLRLKGEHEAAEALALKAWRERPYNRSTTYGALLAIGADASPDSLTPLLRRMAQLDPGVAEALGSEAATGPALDRPKLRRSLGDLNLFFDLLPDAEVKGRIPAFGPRVLGGDGYYQLKPPRLGVTRLVFEGWAASDDIVQEMALLRAAELALKDGREGVFIMSRLDQQVVVSTTVHGMVVRTDPGGYRSVLDVALNRSATSIEGAPEFGWRLLDARAVYRALAPVYIPEKKRLPGYG